MTCGASAGKTLMTEGDPQDWDSNLLDMSAVTCLEPGLKLLRAGSVEFVHLNTYLSPPQGSWASS